MNRLNSILLKDHTNEEAKEGKPVNPIIEKIKQNKIFFYGFPLLVVLFIFSGLFFFIFPTIQFYIKSREINRVLDKNEENTDKSIANLRKAMNEEPTIRGYDNALNTYIPKDPKLGEVLNMIQTKANDFNLESKIGVSKGSSRTSVGNIAKKDSDKKPLIQSITSGEITFKPKSLDQDINAVLMSIEVNLRGDKKPFLDFLNETKNMKPLVNLVFVEYSESTTGNNTSINALLRFESYALKLDEDKLGLELPKKYTKNDKELLSEMKVETFDWNKDLAQQLGISINSEQ